jgi:hypothetical protein
MSLLVNPAIRFDVSFTTLVIAMLVVWRLTHLLWGEDGPGDIFVRLRRLAGTSFFGQLLDCFYCLSLWVAAPIAWILGASWWERGFLWLALSGGEIMLERLTERNHKPPPAIWHETTIPIKPTEEESNNVMLR